MPAPQTVELRELGDDELLRELEDSHQALFNLRFQTATRQLADVSQVRKERRKIARIKTLMHERALTLAAVMPPPPAAVDDDAEQAPADEPEVTEETKSGDETDDRNETGDGDDAEETEE